MRPELALMAAIVITFLYDLIAGKSARKLFNPLMTVLMLACTAACVISFPKESGEVFGGMYSYDPVHSIIKAVLASGTLIVLLQAETWLKREDTEFKRGEFYVLTLSTLLGMFFMISAGHFLMFFIGMELASVPMACLVAFDKYKKNSAEAGAKFILSALFASGLMLYGISFLYGTCGTLYFSDMPQHLTGSALQIMAFVFFFSGLGFKISLVPFHLWTADTYQGAPTAVTSYLSVISKGSAAFVLMAVLVKVFAPMVEQWQTVLYAVIILSITVANLFAVRQQDLKRFLAFSSISQAGYIMLAVISGSSFGMTSLIFYVLVYLAANLGIRGHLHSRAAQRRQGEHVGLQRPLQDKPEARRGDDARPVLPGGDTSFRRLLLEVLRVRRGFPGGLPRAGVHSFDKYCDLAVLLPAGGQGHVHHS